jgi:pimeloyl-ACP methyl ester carboxylesterase
MFHKQPEILQDEFFIWKHDLKEELRAGSRVTKTAKGRIEWSLSGDEGPFVAGIHGAPGGYDQIAALYPAMFNEGFRILSWSRPGYLRTPLNVGKTFGEQADALAALMDALKIEKLAIIAFSAGGPVSLEFALRYPERLSALILESSVSHRYVINPENVEENLLYSKLMFNDPVVWVFNLLAKHGLENILKSVIEIESTLDEKQVEDVVSHIMNNPKKERILIGLIKSMSPASLRRVGLENDLKQLERLDDLQLERITTPTLIIHGIHDADVPFAHAEFAGKSIPKAELLSIEDGFHIMSLCDCDSEVTEKKLEFLRKYAS